MLHDMGKSTVNTALKSNLLSSVVTIVSTDIFGITFTATVKIEFYTMKIICKFLEYLP